MIFRSETKPMKVKKVNIEAIINAPLAKVWQFWTEANHITNWAFASDEWHSPHAENDLAVGGKFTTRMEAKDESFGFDFSGTYNEIVLHKQINYTMDDGRKSTIDFIDQGDTTLIEQTFDAENENPIELQKNGWQAILNNFKKYVEG